jgi:hypothetical protein
MEYWVRIKSRSKCIRFGKDEALALDSWQDVRRKALAES